MKTLCVSAQRSSFLAAKANVKENHKYITNGDCLLVVFRGCLPISLFCLLVCFAYTCSCIVSHNDRHIDSYNVTYLLSFIYVYIMMSMRIVIIIYSHWSWCRFIQINQDRIIGNLAHTKCLQINSKCVARRAILCCICFKHSLHWCPSGHNKLITDGSDTPHNWKFQPPVSFTQFVDLCFQRHVQPTPQLDNTVCLYMLFIISVTVLCRRQRILLIQQGPISYLSLSPRVCLSFATIH